MSKASSGKTVEHAGGVSSCAAFEELAQGTVEYALTLLALMAIITTLALLWHAGEDGVLARLVEDAASHALGGTGPLDIALF